MFKNAVLFCFVSLSNCQVWMNSTMDKELTVEDSRRGRNKSLSLLMSMNYGGHLGFGPICSKSVDLVLERLHSNDDWLPGYNLKLELIDDKCSNALTVSEICEKLFKDDKRNGRIPFMILGGCTTEGTALVAQVLKQINFTATTWLVKKTDVSTKPIKYNAVYQTSNQVRDLYFAVLRHLQTMNWRTIGIFSEDNEFFNEMEKIIKEIISFHKMNISIAHIGPKVPTLDVTSVENVIEMMDKLKEAEIRIIIGHTNSHIEFSCWLYKYGMFGPRYVILGTTWAIFDPQTAKIPQYLDWCTKEMLRDVVESWIFFGFGGPVNIYGENYTDSLGLKFQDVVNTLEEKIFDSSSVPRRDLWWPECYDPTLNALFAINEAEKVLKNKFNSTLADWTTESVNFAKNSGFIARILRQGVHNIDVHGATGYYNYDSVTLKNSNGFKPSIFYQLRYKQSKQTNQNQNLQRISVSFYKSNEDLFVPMNGGFLFGGTKDIPSDNV